MSDNPQSKAVPLLSVANTLQQIVAGDTQELVTAHFRNGFGQLAISDEGHELDKTRHTKLKKKDDNAYTTFINGAKAVYKQQYGSFWKDLGRRLGLVKNPLPTYEQPALLYSPLTIAAEQVVKVGATLREHLTNVQKFPEHVQRLEQRAAKLALEEAALLQQRDQLHGSAEEYTAAIPSTEQVLQLLATYTSLSVEEQQGVQDDIHRDYDALPIDDKNIRSTTSGYLRKALFTLSQLVENTASDVKNAEQLLQSNKKQREALQRTVQRLWELYNPAREAAVQLHAAYRELTAQLEDGILVHDITEVVANVDLLVSDAQRSAATLEHELVGKIKAAQEIYALEQQWQRQLTRGSP